MTVVSIAEWPAAGRPFTVDELDRMPDDGRRYELVDGVLIVSPAPSVPHQLVLTALIVSLEQARPSDVRVLPGPGGRMAIETELIPEVAAGQFEHVRRGRISAPA